MRKIFTTLSVLSMIIVTLVPTIACLNAFNDPNVYRITVVTDGQTISDRSFNQASYEGAKLFQSEFKQWVKSSDVTNEFKNKRVEISWDNPGIATLDSLLASYNKAVFINSKVIIASGSLHHDALVKAQNDTLKKQQIKFIFVDGNTPSSEVPNDNKKLAGLQYKAEQSGFLAGLAGAVWLTAHNAEYGGLNNLKMSTYGGKYITGVISYMYGFYWAIKFFNDPNNAQQELMKLVQILNPNFNTSSVPAILPIINFVNVSSNQFSGNFKSGSPAAKAINDILVAAGANIIFPVAGPQTQDTLSALQKGNGKVIGVDTDQQIQYPQSTARFITSAKKNIVNSVNFMLWKAVGRVADHFQHPEDKNANDIFTKDPSNGTFYGGADFIDIAKNDAIKDIYDGLIKLGEKVNDGNNLLDRVSIGWQEVLKLGKDFWENGITAKYNPFK